MKACERGMSTYLLPLANSDSYLSGFQVCSAKRIEMASLVGRPYDTMSLKVPEQIVPPHCTAVSGTTCCLSAMFLSKQQYIFLASFQFDSNFPGFNPTYCHKLTIQCCLKQNSILIVFVSGQQPIYF